jgi:hypothetical protein
MLCPAAPSKTVLTVVLMPKKSDSVSQPECRRENHLDRIDHLLEIAGITRNAQTQDDLEIAILTTQSAYVSEQLVQDQPSTKGLLRPLELSVARTLMCLRRVKKHGATKHIDFPTYPLESGIVKALPLLQLGRHKEFPTIPEGTIIGIDIENLLCDWKDRIRQVNRRGRARPRRRDKDEIVLCAAQFFCRHSVRKPTNDVNNPFPAFVEQFYETVTGAASPRSLNSQITKVLGALKTAGVLEFGAQPPRSINSQQFTKVRRELS